MYVLLGGGYIAFLDSDDFVESTWIEKLVSAFQKYDIDLSICGFYHFSKDGSKIGEDQPNISVMLDSKECLFHMLEQEKYKYYGLIWNKLYRRDIIAKDHIRFAEDIKMLEGELFVVSYLTKCKKYAFYDSVPLYYYVTNENSATRISRYKGMFHTHELDFLKAFDEMEKKIQCYSDERIEDVLFFKYMRKSVLTLKKMFELRERDSAYEAAVKKIIKEAKRRMIYPKRSKEKLWFYLMDFSMRLTYLIASHKETIVKQYDRGLK